MTGYSKSITWVLWLSFLYVHPESFGSFQQDTSSVKSGVFDSDNYLELRIITDIDTLLQDKIDNSSYHLSRLSYKSSDSTWISLDADIRVRGNFRKQSENCDFPPLKIRIDKKNRMNTIFENNRELKMVTHCQSNIPEYEQYVIQEYLIYRLYSILSDISYKTRLLKVTYIDKNDPGYTFQKFAFFLEDQDLMEERLNGHFLALQTVNPEDIDWDHYVIISFFQYMIINTDWSLPILHNIDLFSPDYFKPPIPVPFDFDWSGLINIPYKVPTVAGMQVRIPERIYKGPCLKRKEANKIKQLFQEKKNEISNLYINCPFLDDNYKTETLKNLQIFYQILDDKYIFDSTFMEKCD
jgi:hypothetical protein